MKLTTTPSSAYRTKGQYTDSSRPLYCRFRIHGTNSIQMLRTKTDVAVGNDDESFARANNKATVGRLFVLDLSGGRVLSVNPDGSDRKVIVTECRHPDGVVVDAEAGHIYWTNMGVPSLNDGTIEGATSPHPVWVGIAMLILGVLLVALNEVLGG